jgi:branched-chain amino acid transport system permease protein
MSAAQWRRAMNTKLTEPVKLAPAYSQKPVDSEHLALDPYADSNAPKWLKFLWQHLEARHVWVLAFVLMYPAMASPFFVYQVGAQSLAFGIIAMSLAFLSGFGGMVSLAQMTVAGIAGYAVAVLGSSSSPEISLGWPWYVAIPAAIIFATICATLIGWLSVRTEGIYTIMITLAIGVAFYYLALQNYTVFNGFQGLRELHPPTLLGVDWRQAVPFYYLTLASALSCYFLMRWVIRAPFGIALQGIRDNPRRMAALGYNVVAHKVAAYSLAGFVAAIGGVLLAWYNALMTPGSVGTGAMINILVIAVLGGVKHPIASFVGAIVFVLLQTFAIDLIDRERFNLVIGLVFLAIVLFSPDGLLGLWNKLRSRFATSQVNSSMLLRR